MSHFGESTSGVKATPTEWLKVGSQIGQLVNRWAERNDLVVYVGGEMSAPAPALYDPRVAEIEVNAKEAFGYADPEIIGDLNDRGMMFEFPKATGAILHEACHARFTQWDLFKSSADLKPNENEALHLLEESRIEGLGVLTFPRNREFLKASAMEIVLGDLDIETLSEMSSTRVMAKLAGLVGGRIDAGVLDYADVSETIDLVMETLGAELYGQLRDLWRKAQAHSQHANAEPMYPLAIEWERLVSEKAIEKGEESEDGESGKTCGIPIPNELMEKMKEVLEKSAEETEWSAIVELGEQEQDEKREETAKDKAKDGKQKEEAKKMESKVFSKNTAEMPYATSGSTLVETRKPTSGERVASVKVSEMLERAKYRERDVTQITSVLPAGRLRSRTFIQGKAMASKGILAPVEAWEHKVRKHTDEPTLTLGVLVDVSGSMGGAMNPMATTAWVMAEAGRRIQARTAMVYYGTGVFPTLRAGEKPSEVKVYTAPDGTEKFDEAFMAIDGHLNLLYGTGARVLVIVSDGHYTADQSAKAKKWVAECDKLGVAVLWITFDATTSYLDSYLKGLSGNGVSLAGFTPEQSAILIGKACADTIEKIGKRNA
jgi:hypothetical protein